MTYRVEITEQAEQEIDEALAWLAERSRQAAARWHGGLRRAFGTLNQYPRRWPLAPENAILPQEIRQMLYGRRSGRYRILFEVRDAEQAVYILHVLHGARRWLGESEPEDDEDTP